jgi:hypothetical protein
LLAKIRNKTNKGLAIGKEHFKKEVKALTGRHMLPTKMRRPAQV